MGAIDSQHLVDARRVYTVTNEFIEIVLQQRTLPSASGPQYRSATAMDRPGERNHS